MFTKYYEVLYALAHNARCFVCEISGVLSVVQGRSKLLLARKIGRIIHIGDDITVTNRDVERSGLIIQVSAPEHLLV